MTENVHTVKILDLMVSDSMTDIFIVTNYVSTDLSRVLHQKDADMEEDHTVELLFKIVCALNFIHKANIIHRDIKPSNILVNASCEVTLCDFSQARSLPKIEINKKEYSRQKMAEKLVELRLGT